MFSLAKKKSVFKYSLFELHEVLHVCTERLAYIMHVKNISMSITKQVTSFDYNQNIFLLPCSKYFIITHETVIWVVSAGPDSVSCLPPPVACWDIPPSRPGAMTEPHPSDRVPTRPVSSRLSLCVLWERLRGSVIYLLNPLSSTSFSFCLSSLSFIVSLRLFFSLLSFKALLVLSQHVCLKSSMWEELKLQWVSFKHHKSSAWPFSDSNRVTVDWWDHVSVSMLFSEKIRSDQKGIIMEHFGLGTNICFYYKLIL